MFHFIILLSRSFAILILFIIELISRLLELKIILMLKLNRSEVQLQFNLKIDENFEISFRSHDAMNQLRIHIANIII